jgi:hypothetical protein
VRARTGGTAELRVEHLWDGRAAEPGEVVRLEVEGLTAAEGEPGGLRLSVDAAFHGDPPPAAPPGPTRRLWEHEVVELFVAGPGEPDRVPYLEVELGPHGHHLVLRLAGVRRVVESGLPLDYQVWIDGLRWSGEARLPAAWLPPRPWRLNAYALHGTAPERRYLAMRPVPGAEPDFHQPERFVPWDDLSTP